MIWNPCCYSIFWDILFLCSQTVIKYLSHAQFIWSVDQDIDLNLSNWAKACGCYTDELIQLLYIQIDARVGFGRVLYMKSWSRCKSIHVRIIVMFCIYQFILFCFTFICHHTFYLLSNLHILSSVSTFPRWILLLLVWALVCTCGCIKQVWHLGRFAGQK